MEVIAEKLAGRNYSVRIEKHRVVEDTEYIRLIILLNKELEIHVREFIIAGTILRYSYQLLMNKKAILRYDNVPHHPEIRTHPHHKHKGNEVYSLHDHSLETFFDEALSYIEHSLRC